MVRQVPHKPFFRTCEVNGHRDHTPASLPGVPPVGLIGKKIPQDRYQKGPESTGTGIGSCEHCSLEKKDKKVLRKILRLVHRGAARTDERIRPDTNKHGRVRPGRLPPAGECR